MRNKGIITENRLDEWVRGNAIEAQGKIMELVYRLVSTSAPQPKERRFPLADSIGQPGPDGVLDTDSGFDPFVPKGRSFWEVGTGINASAKATKDYRELTKATPASIRQETTFVFVTPLSGRRDWQHTWKDEAQAKWLEDRRQLNEWRDVRIIDGTVLIDWLQHFPSVEIWLAEVMGIAVQHIQTIEQHWADIKTIGDHSLTPEVFLVNRSKVCQKLDELICRDISQLEIITRYPEQVVDFVAAYVENSEENNKIDIAGRCLVISNAEGWNDISSLHEPHILVANFDLDSSHISKTKLIQKANKGKHAIIFAGLHGGISDPTRITLPSPNIYQIKEALENAGYNEEHARILAQKSDGNLSSLQRCLQNLPLMPQWAQRGHEEHLTAAMLMGAWDNNSKEDKLVLEKLSSKSYDEWIVTIRDLELRSSSPLFHRDGNWKFVMRFEGWYSLGKRLFDEHLNLFKEVVVSVLREPDPKFELPPNARFAANIHGKVLKHSQILRHGLAETLALLGSHPRALTSCSYGIAESTALIAVREIFDGADWIIWASLNDLLPLLAEASPNEFLDAVENALHSDSGPFEQVFAQESSSLTGRNYMTGLLWALETLAWDARYLTRVVIILGELASKDPGGNWSNRPINSLTTILLPWLPQTVAPIIKRKAAVETLLRELPEIAWMLLKTLLPRLHMTSMYTHKPSWREIIPDNWISDVTLQEYIQQTVVYAELAIIAAKQDTLRLSELIDRLDDLPDSSRDQFLDYLGSDSITFLPEKDRLQLWIKIVEFVLKHRKYSDAEWAMPEDTINVIATLGEKIAPSTPFYRHQRLFSQREYDLFEEEEDEDENENDYISQRKKLDSRREEALREIFINGGLEVILEFASVVETPSSVGRAFSMIGGANVQDKIIPALLKSTTNGLSHFAEGYVIGRFNNSGWQWFDNIDTSQWTKSEKEQILSYLPFNRETWDRVTQLLGTDEKGYWYKTAVNPLQSEGDLALAIDRLIQYKRPQAAVTCLEWVYRKNKKFNNQQAVRVLVALLHVQERLDPLNTYAIVEIIKALQNDPDTNKNDLFQIEWAFLPLLDRRHGGAPKYLEERLADEPAFFCEVIRAIFRSKKESISVEVEVTENEKNIAMNAYKLLKGWRRPPGSQQDGTFKGEVLKSWLDYVKVSAEESGHLDIALLIVGEELIHVPSDPDGLWIHHSAATLLNDKEAKKMRDGFRTALYNSRGVHSWTAGIGERDLANKYRNQAEAVETHGYHRLASTLRELAESYEYVADREASRDPFDD